MKLFNTIKRLARRATAAAVVTAAVAGFGLSTHSQQVSADACDKVNIVYCGLNGSSIGGYINSLQSDYNNNDGGNGYHDVKAVYNYVGASQGAINGMNASNTKIGEVHRNGDITVDGKLVATNAKVAARFSVSGATAIPGTSPQAYLRTTTSSFAHDTERAILHFDANGNLQFGGIIGCGNAVTGHPVPQPKPDYSITKEVSVKGQDNFKNTVTVAPGTHVIYKVTVKSTGNTPVKNVIVKDAAAAHLEIDGTLTRDGKSVGNDIDFFTKGYTIDSLKNGTSTVFKFEAVIGANDTVANCVDKSVPNTANITDQGQNLPPMSDIATVTEHCLPKPVYACKNLDVKPGYINDANGNQFYTFTAHASAQNATIVKYEFFLGDGTQSTKTTSSDSAQATNIYKPGKYNIHVVVTFKDADGKLYTDSGASCTQDIAVKPIHQLACDDLVANPGVIDANGSQMYSLTAKALTKNETITKYAFDFGDGKDQTVTTSATSKMVSHNYAPGEYTAKVTVYSADDNATSPQCQAHVSVKKPVSSLVCNTLSALPGSTDASGNQRYAFLAYATPKNVTIDSYTFNFGDGSNPAVVPSAGTSTGTNHLYAPGSYTARVTVNATNGTHATSPTCMVQITVPPVTPPSSNLVCNALEVVPGTVNSDGSQNFTLSASATPTNATITSYVFSFGDGSTDGTVTSANTSASTTHTYASSTTARTASVTVYGKDANGTVVSNTNANCTKPVTPAVQTPGVGITKVVNGQKSIQTSVGTQFTYTLKVTNNGQQDLTNVVVVDSPDTGVTLLSADQGSIANNTWTYTIPSLKIGESQSFNLVAVVPNYLAGTINNTACVNAPEVNPENPTDNDSCDSATVSVTPPVTPPTTPPQVQPTSLVNTGAGSVIAIAAVVAAVSAVAHRLFLSRKLAR